MKETLSMEFLQRDHPVLMFSTPMKRRLFPRGLGEAVAVSSETVLLTMMENDPENTTLTLTCRSRRCYAFWGVSLLMQPL